MTDEVKLRKEISRGDRAKTIIEDELFKETVVAIKANYMSQFLATSFKDSDGRTAIWIAIHQLDKILGHLTELMNTGKLASKQLEEIKKPK